MLSRLWQISTPEAPTITVIQKLLTETIVDRDIGAQEIFHMLQKLPLSLCSRTFLSLNVNNTVFKHVYQDNENPLSTPNFILAYMNKPISLESLPLLEAACSWSFYTCWKKNQWKHIFPPMIVHVLPRYHVIPSFDDLCYSTFCWSELLLYFPFHTLPNDIGSIDAEIIAHWEQRKGTYTPWHIHQEIENPQTPHTEDQSTSDTPLNSMQMNEWKILSQLHPSYNIEVDDLDIIGYHDFDANHN